MHATRRRWAASRRRMISSLAVVLVLCTTSVAPAAGVAFNDNFSVLASDQATADAVLAQAETFRKEIARQWLGKELPAGAGPTMITVVDSRLEDRGLTWPIDNPKRKYHKVWLRTSPDRAPGSTLRHEITHVVFATQFPHRLPAWVEEGIASLGDDPERSQIRARVIRRLARAGDWPRLETVFREPTIPTSHQAEYSIATSVVEYLLSRADGATLLRFAATGRDQGWDRAAEEHYGLRSVGDLQAAWQTWAAREVSGSTSAVLPVAYQARDERLRHP